MLCSVIYGERGSSSSGLWELWETRKGGGNGGRVFQAAVKIALIVSIGIIVGTIFKALWETCVKVEGGGRGPALHRFSIEPSDAADSTAPRTPRRAGGLMGARPRDRDSSYDRLEGKTLDAQFRSEICEGLSCSPFEAEAVLQVVKEVYLPWFDASSTNVPPGKVTLVAVSSDEGAGKAIADCEKVTVCLTVHRGAEDDQLLRKGTAFFRRGRIRDLCQEALSQGALLTREDLAHRIFFVSPRTITRDLAILRQEDPDRIIPLRSTVHDIGPVLTHRTQIIRLALEGKTTTQICNIMHHSPEAVANYLSTFTRCAQLVEREMQVGQIAFLLRKPKSLIRDYVDILVQCKQDKNMRYHLDELLRLASGGKKNHPTNGGHHG